MVNITTIDEKIYNILLKYIKGRYLGDTLFCCISGCNNRVIKYIKDNLSILQSIEKEYHIMPIFEEKTNFSFNEIVRIRNDKDIKKIIIFTNGSISNIDSLKDFAQVDIKKIPFMDLWGIIQEECEIYWNENDKYNAIEKFLKDLTDIIQPEIYNLIEYLEKVNKDSVIYDDLILALNTDLYMFNIWASSCNTVLRKSKLQTIYHNSDPIQIHKKITSPKDIEKIQKSKDIDKAIRGRFGNIRKQKTILREMFYERKYSQAYREIYYEIIENILKGSGKKKKRKTHEEEDSYSYTNIYSLALGALADLDNDVTVSVDEIKRVTSFNDIDFENDAEEDYHYKVDIPYYSNEQSNNEDIFVNLEDAKVKWSQFQNNFADKDYREDIVELCDNLNIHNKDKIILKNKLERYLNARDYFIKQNNNPINLNGLLNNSIKYVTSFFELIKELYNFRQATIKNISMNGLINKLVNIDIKIKNNEIYVPFYSPLLIFHLHNMRSRYEKCLSIINKMNTYRVEILEQINTKILNEYIVYDNKTYLLSQDNSKFPYYIKYICEEYVDSIITINFNVISPYIIKYIKKYPYKNIIKLCLIGEVDLKSLKNTLLKILEKIDYSNLTRFRLKIITKSPNDVREVLISLFEQKESLNKKIECTIERMKLNINLEKYVENLIIENDITLFLDSSIMYLKTRFNKKNDSYIERVVSYRDISSEINSISYVLEGKKDSMPIIPNVINVLQNSIENENLQNGELDKYNLNNNLISCINKTLSDLKNEDKEVILLSSDSKIDEQILDNRNLSEIDEAVNKNDKIKVLTFCKCTKNKDEYTFKESNHYIEFNASNLLDSFLIDSKLGFSFMDIDFEDIIIRMSYGNFPQAIDIAYYFIKEYDDEISKKIEIEVECKKMFDTFIKVSIKPELFLDNYNKENFVKLLLRSAKTEEDVVFIYSFENIYNDIKINYIGNIDYKDKSNITKISSINRNTVYRILKILGEEAISEQAINNFSEMLKVNNFSISNLPMLQILISKYNHNYNNMKYLYENIGAVIKNMEVK